AQALWLLLIAFWPTPDATPWRSGLTCIAGAATFVAEIIVPLAIDIYQGKPWTQLEMPGLMPGPTAITTLGVLLMLRSRLAAPAAIIPVTWCAYSGALYWAMNSY